MVFFVLYEYKFASKQLNEQNGAIFLFLLLLLLLFCKQNILLFAFLYDSSAHANVERFIGSRTPTAEGV